jgi:hypothetical protein
LPVKSSRPFIASALVLLVIAGTLNYVDRAALSIANPLIGEELGLSLANMGPTLGGSASRWDEAGQPRVFRCDTLTALIAHGT